MAGATASRTDGIRYWDPYETSTSASSDTGTSTGPTYYTDTSGICTGSYIRIPVYYPPPPKRVLVHCPKVWGDDIRQDFVRLINFETKTGWKIEMIIDGKILVTDPNIEKRTMEEMLPLYKHRASQEDIDKINNFIKEHPIK